MENKKNDFSRPRRTLNPAKRALSVLLAMAMLIGIIPLIPASAAGSINPTLLNNFKNILTDENGNVKPEIAAVQWTEHSHGSGVWGYGQQNNDPSGSNPWYESTATNVPNVMFDLLDAYQKVCDNAAYKVRAGNGSGGRNNDPSICDGEFGLPGPVTWRLREALGSLASDPTVVKLLGNVTSTSETNQSETAGTLAGNVYANNMCYFYEWFIRSPPEIVAGSKVGGAVTRKTAEALKLYPTIKAIPSSVYLSRRVIWQLVSTRYRKSGLNHYYDYSIEKVYTEDFNEVELADLKAALEQWEAVEWDIDLASLNRKELLGVLEALEEAKGKLNATTVDGYALSATQNDAILALYNLPHAGSTDRGGIESYGSFRKRILNALAANLVNVNIKFYHEKTNGVLWAADPKVFNDAVPPVNSFNPYLNGYGNYLNTALAELEMLYAEAVVHNETIQSETGNTEIWDAAKDMAWSQGYRNLAENAGVDLNDQENWLNNLDTVIKLWKLYQFREESEAILHESDEYGDNFHEGAEGETDEDSNYTIPTETLQRWYTNLDVEVKFIDSLTGDLAVLKDEVYDAAFQAAMRTRLAALGSELTYRDAQPWSEWNWYTYRNFFRNARLQDYTSWSSTDILKFLHNEEETKTPPPAYQGVRKNAEAYLALENNARTYYAGNEALFKEIYFNGYDTSFYVREIEPLLTQLYIPLAARFTEEVESCWAIVDVLDKSNFIKVNTSLGELQVFSWETFGQLNKAIKKLDVNVWNELISAGKLGLLGNDDVDSATVQAHWDYLHNVVKVAYEAFLENPKLYYKQTDLPTPTRPAYEEDIVPGHEYTDLDDAAINELIAKLDILLGEGGNLPDLIALLEPLGVDLSSLGLEDMGIDLTDPNLNVGSLVENVLSNVLYSDKIVNTVIGMLFPLVLEQFENVWKDTILGMQASPPSPVSSMAFNTLYSVLDKGQILPNISPNALRAPLNIYPKLFAKNVNAAMFPEVHAALDASGAGQSMSYPSEAWSQKRSALLYNEEGVLDLKWEINGDKDRFIAALSSAFEAIMPLAGALFLNQDNSFYCSELGSLRVPVLGLGTLGITLNFAKNPGYASIITPLFEMMLGEDAGDYLLTEAQLSTIKSGNGLVNAIVDPLYDYIDKLKAKPVSEILALLPNLMYAFSVNRIMPLLDHLVIGISYKVNVHESFLGTIADLIAGSSLNGSIAPMKIIEMLSGEDSELDLSFLSDIDALLDKVLTDEEGNKKFELPTFNAGRIATYGMIYANGETIPGASGPLTTKRNLTTAGPRHYIKANKADVFRAAVECVLNSNMLGDKFTIAHPEHVVAALAELVKPTGYPLKVTPFEYVAPEIRDYAELFPGWWQGENIVIPDPPDTIVDPSGAAGAKLDADYIIENADSILNMVWKLLFGGTDDTDGTAFEKGVDQLLVTQFATPEQFQVLVETIQGLLNSETIAPILESLGSFLESNIIVGGVPWNLNAALNALKTFDASAVTITKVEEFVNALISFLEPAGPLLDFLLGGQSLELLHISGDAGLIKLLGGNGYENGIVPIWNALLAPLGKEGVIKSQANYDSLGTNYNAKLHVVLDPLVTLYDTVRKKPVDTVLALLPNLVYFISTPAATVVGEDVITHTSPLQQALDNLLHPLYVAVDTLRPITDIMGLLTSKIEPEKIPDGISIGSSGIYIDAPGLLNKLIADELSGVLPAPLQLDMRVEDFLLGEYVAADNYLKADKAAVLFMLLQDLGLLDLIKDYESLTYLIQYERIPGLGPVDYARAPEVKAEAEYNRSWYTQKHSKYLTDNADAVLEFLWRFIFENEDGTLNDAAAAEVQALLGDVQLELKTTLKETVLALFGNQLYVKENLDKLVIDTILPLKDTILTLNDQLATVMEPIGGLLPGLTPEPLTVDKILALISISDGTTDQKITIDGLFAPFEAYAANPPEITNKDQFRGVLLNLLEPFVPVLDFLLAGKNIEILDDDSINNGQGFLKAYGYEGYRDGLLPLLLGLGADVPGYLAEVTDYDTFIALGDQDKLAAVLDPILFLVEALAEDPVHTVLQVLPNLAYLISDNDDTDGLDNSVLQQSVDRLLYPVTVLLNKAGYPLGDLLGDVLGDFDLTNLGVNIILNDLLASLLPDAQLSIADFMMGTERIYGWNDAENSTNYAPFASVGMNGPEENKAAYVEASLPELLTQLLDKAGVFDLLEENSLTGLVELLNYQPPGPKVQAAKVDYAAAPQAVGAVATPGWFDKTLHAQYLTDNADAVLNYLWSVIFDSPEAKAEAQQMINDLMGMEANLEIGDTLEDTVKGIFGNDFFVKDNLTLLVDTILGLEPTLEGLNAQLPMGLTIDKILSLIRIGDAETSLGIEITLESVFAPFNDYKANIDTIQITNEADFKAELSKLLKPALPLLRVFLAGQDIKLINEADINEGKGFLKILGYDGYQTGLLPLLQALGADLPDYLDTIVSYDDFTAASDEEQIAAVIDPILELLDNLSRNPVQTLLKVLPNLAYFIADPADASEKSLLQQSLNNLLYPIGTLAEALPPLGEMLDGLGVDIFDLRAGDMLNGLLAELLSSDAVQDILPGAELKLEDLVTGTVTVFAADANKSVGRNSSYDEAERDNKAAYIKVDLADTLTQLLDKAGVFTLLEDSGLTGLVKLLNSTGNDTPDTVEKVDYDFAPALAALNKDEVPKWFKDTDAQYLTDNLDAVLNYLWNAIFSGNQTAKDEVAALLGNVPLTLEDTLEDTVWGLLGNDYFVKDNLMMLVDILIGLEDDIQQLELGLPLGITLDKILEMIAIGENTSSTDKTIIRISDLFDGFRDFKTKWETKEINGKADFEDAAVELLAPAMPLLRVFLAGKDIKIINDDTVNGGKGFLKILGYDGYQTGLLPILQALGAELPGYLGTVVSYEDFLAHSEEQQLRDILAPIFALLDSLAKAPSDTLLKVLPNLAYFIADPADGNSLLQQSLNNILYPIVSLMKSVDALSGLLDGLPVDIFNLRLGDMLNGLLADLLSGDAVQKVLPGASLQLEDLLIGEEKLFTDGYETVGRKGAVDNQASYLAADKPALLTQLLAKLGVLTLIEANELEGIVNFFNPVRGTVEKVDYAYGPNALSTGAINYPSWFKKTQHAQYLVDNVDLVIDYAWQMLFEGNQEGKDYVSGLLAVGGGNIQIEDTFSDTIYGVLGNEFLVQKNFNNIVNTIAGLKDTINGLELPIGLNLTELLANKVLVIGNEDDVTNDETVVIDLDVMFQPFLDYQTNPPVINASNFESELTKLVTPLMPLLRIFLAGKDIRVINDPNIAGGAGFLKILGADGYDKGLLPILQALGAELPGYLDQLVSTEDFLAGTAEEQAAAIVKPIIYLLDTLAAAPAETLLKVLPNIAYFISDANGAENSLLQQSINNILAPLNTVFEYIPMLKGEVNKLLGDLDLGALGLGTMLNGLLDGVSLKLEDFIVGEVTVFDGDYKNVGVSGENDNRASYIKSDAADLLTQLLDKLGVFKLLEGEEGGTNLSGLISLLNAGPPQAPGHIIYGTQGVGNSNKLYYTLFWRKDHAQYVADHAQDFLDRLWMIIYGKPFGSLDGNGAAETFLGDLLGSQLFTQANFDALLAAVQGAIPEIADMELIPNRTLYDLLDSVVTIEGKAEPIKISEILDHLQTWQPTGPVTDQASFMQELVNFLTPLAPVLDFILAGKDIKVLGDFTAKDGSKGIITAYGYDGYRYGLIPIYEAFLKPLGKEGEITSPEDYAALGDQEKIEALLHPILFALEEILSDPANNLLAVLPTLAYFVNTQTGSPGSALEQSLDRILFPLNTILSTLGSELSLEIDVPQLLQGIVTDLGLYININKLFANIQIGSLTQYNSVSGGNARYLAQNDASRSELVTVIVRTVVDMFNEEKNRSQLADLLADTLGTKTNFGRWIISTFLSYHAAFMQTTKLGQDYRLNNIYWLWRIFYFMTKYCEWFLKLFF